MKNFLYVILSRGAATLAPHVICLANHAGENLSFGGRDPSRRFAPLRVTITLFVSFAIILLNVKQVYSQAGIEMEISASYQFGEHITFTARLLSPVPIQKATIYIHDSAQVITHVGDVAFNEQGVSEYRFDTRLNTLRPFTTVLWRYEVTFPDGSTAQSITGSIRYDDDRFAWQALETDALRVHWYNGDEQFGTAALNAGQAGLNSIRGFFEPNLSIPVDIFVYASEGDLRGTLYGAEGWVAGHANSAAGVVMVTVEPGANQNILMEQRIPHELMHVMLYRQMGVGYESVPAWLREGISMLVEVYPNTDYDNALKDAVARDTLIPIKDLCASFSPRIDTAFLAYAESRSFTNYLRGQYGTDGLLRLATVYANGVDCERGTERAFGVTLVNLERNWRVNVLGQTDIVSSMVRFVPYLALLCLVVFFPLIGALGKTNRRGHDNG